MDIGLTLVEFSHPFHKLGFYLMITFEGAERPGSDTSHVLLANFLLPFFEVEKRPDLLTPIVLTVNGGLERKR